MILNKDVLICIGLLFILQVIIWFQLNGQLKWSWFKDNYLLMSLLGIPISYGLLNATKYGFQGFGELWPIRLLAFAVGMISFPIITYFILGEGITIKTGLSIVLAVIIMLIQLL
jgi:hypothetical protein